MRSRRLKYSDRSQEYEQGYDMDIGILGGTFDPVHRGHLAIAEEAKRRLELVKVLFIPAGKPWLKVEREITPANHRMNMVNLAIKGKPYFELSAVEVERTGPTYTVDTLQDLHRELGPDVGFYFILGWDNLAEITTWREPANIVKLCKLVAFTRADTSVPDLMSLEDLVPDVSSSTILLDMPPIDVSSSDIRKRVAAGLPIRDLVPETVEEYIQRHHLYQVDK